MQDIDTPTRSLPPSAATSHAAHKADTPRNANPSKERNNYAPHALTLLSAALLAACGGGEGSNDSGGEVIDDSGLPSAPGFNNNPQALTDQDAARFLQQSQFASTPADIAAVRSTNFAAYLRRQLNKPVSTTWDWLESRGYGADATLDKTVYSSEIAEYAIWRDLMSAPDATRKRVALALSEFFVISLNSMDIDWRGYAVAAYWDILNKHAFGNFRDLLQDVTLSPAMGYYLNTRGNKKANTTGRLPDENYAREVMQLFTIGLYELNIDGSVVFEGGKKLESYDSDDVSQLARVFTGYDFDRTLHPYNTNSGITFPGNTYRVWPREYARRAMTQSRDNESDHSPEEIQFLGKKIAAGTKSATALKEALDTLFNHANVGPFFGRQMIQRLVTSNPSPAYVARVASAFNNNGAGVRGDMRAVWTAILLDDEARGAANLSNPSFGKLREPMLRFTQWARSFGVTSKAGSWKLADLSDSSYNLGQSPMRSPSVFNYFRPGYVPPGTVMAKPGAEATAPEFQLVNETTTGSYLNYMQSRIRSGIRVNNPTVALPEYVSNTDALDFEGNYSGLLALINNSVSNDAESQRVAQALVTQLNLLLCAGQLASTTVATMTAALKAAMLQGGKTITNASTTQMDKLRRDLVAAAILMVMACPDYLIQK